MEILFFLFVLFVIYSTIFINEIRAFYSSNVIGIMPQLYFSIRLFFSLLLTVRLVYSNSSLQYLRNGQSHRLGLI